MAFQEDNKYQQSNMEVFRKDEEKTVKPTGVSLIKWKVTGSSLVVHWLRLLLPVQEGGFDPCSEN